MTNANSKAHTNPTEPSRPHVCQLYRNAEGKIVDPAKQGGVGCFVCEPRATGDPEPPEPTVKRLDIFGRLHDTFRLENEPPMQQAKMI